jgi:coenzyme PQQ biosynthesis protein PqqD
LFSEVTKKTVYLNDTASAIWKLCDGTRTIAQLIELLKQAYSDSEHDFESDVRSTIDDLFAQGALKWISSGEAPH